MGKVKWLIGVIMISKKRLTRRENSFVDNVVFPVFSGLKQELIFLEKGNITWSFYNQKIENLFCIANHVGINFSNTYDHFLREYEVFVPMFEKHDKLILDLEKLANDILNKFSESRDFIFCLEDILSNYGVPIDIFMPFCIRNMINEVDGVGFGEKFNSIWKENRIFFVSLKDGDNDFFLLSELKKNLVCSIQKIIREMEQIFCLKNTN